MKSSPRGTRRRLRAGSRSRALRCDGRRAAQAGEEDRCPRRFEAAIKEIWSLQPRFEQRSGQRPFRLIEHARFRAGWDFLDLRCRSGELEGERAQLAQWWDQFVNATPEAREAMLKPDTEPKKRPRARSRGRKRRAGTEAATPTPAPDAPPE
jgi:poly(A) polymerase